MQQPKASDSHGMDCTSASPTGSPPRGGRRSESREPADSTDETPARVESVRRAPRNPVNHVATHGSRPINEPLTKRRVKSGSVARPRSPNRYKGKKRWPYTAAWQKAVLDALARQKAAGGVIVNKSQLAIKLKVTRAAITKLLEDPPESKGSSLVDPVCDLLGVARPVFKNTRQEDAVKDLQFVEEHGSSEEYDELTSDLRRRRERIAERLKKEPR